MAKGTKVQKSLSPDEKSILANIKSLLDQFEQIEVAEPEEGGEETEVAEATDGMPAGDEEQEALEKKKLEGIDKSETADADAEERVETLPEDDEAALSVLKALIGGKVTKSVQPAVQPDRNLTILAQVAKSLNVLAANQQKQGEAICGILSGIGITDDTLKSVTKSKPSVPQRGSVEDVAKVLTEVLGVVQKSAEAQTPKSYGLRDAMTALVGVEEVNE